jgi:hypothetical protein
MRSIFEKSNLTVGVLLIILGIAAFIETFTDLTSWGWVIVLFSMGIFSAAVYWKQRSNMVFMIPTYSLWSIAGLIGLTSLNFLGEIIATYVLVAIGFPFLVFWLKDKTHWWLLIPAYVLVVVGVMVAFIGFGWLTNFLIPAFVMFAIATPFFVVYFRDSKNWWSLIPGGVLGLIGLSFLLASQEVKFLVPVLMVAVGVVIVFRNIVKSRGSR